MKILAFTDLHLSSAAIKKLKEKIRKHKPEILVCAGDVSIFEEGLPSMLRKLHNLKKPLVIIHGNHETESAMRDACHKYKNLIFIHGTYYKHHDHIFLGYGGEGFSLVDKNFMPLAKTFKKVIRDHKQMKIILVTHAPPYGTELDLIIDQHCGNKTIRDFIKRNRVDAHVCGHLHENFEKEQEYKGTKILNPGPFGKIIDV